MAAKIKVSMTPEESKFWKSFKALLESLSPAESVEDDDADSDEGDDEDDDEKPVRSKKGKKRRVDEDEDDDADDGDDDESAEGDSDEDSDDDSDEDDEDEKPRSKKGKKSAGPTLADVMAGFKILAKKTSGKKAGVAILKKLKVKAPSEIDEEDFPRVLKLLKAAK